MKLLLVLAVVGLAYGLPPLQEPTRFYHEAVGIKEAARIKATEEAADFDGSRIVGGSAAGLGSYPHMGGLVITLTSGATSVCGSSMISNNRAVTAAHCWFDGRSQARQFVVVLGSTLLFSGGTRVTTTNVVNHPNWNPNTIQNDVAMITINWVNYSNNIRNILLPTNLLNNQLVGWWANAAGFGTQRDGAGISTAQTLHHVALQIISNADCQRTFGNIIVASTLCIDGSAGRSTCGGDSGGPLQVNSDGTRLVGITSFGSAAGCQRGFPAAFARVSSFNAWIQSRL